MRRAARQRAAQRSVPRAHTQCAGRVDGAAAAHAAQAAAAAAAAAARRRSAADAARDAGCRLQAWLHARAACGAPQIARRRAAQGVRQAQLTRSRGGAAVPQRRTLCARPPAPPRWTRCRCRCPRPAQPARGTGVRQRAGCGGRAGNDAPCPRSTPCWRTPSRSTPACALGPPASPSGGTGTCAKRSARRVSARRRLCAAAGTNP